VGRAAEAAGAGGARQYRGQDHRRLHAVARGVPYKDIWDPLGRIFDAFGIGRCMWGTDWTRAVALLTYAQGVEPFRVTDRLSDGDRAALMGGTLQKVYDWAPSSPSA